MIRRWISGALAAVLLVALAACTGGRAHESSYQIAGGNPEGVYYNYGLQLASAAQSEIGAGIDVMRTQGSVENLQLVASGEALIGFAQGDTAVDALLGQGQFSEPLPVRAVAKVYDEYVHIVVPADSPAESVADLAGAKLSLGSESSGVRVIASRVIEAAGVSLDDIESVSLGIDASVEAMQRGEIDAFFWVGGLPTPGIERLVETQPIRLLPIDPQTIERVNEGHAGVYRLAEFPVGIYSVEGAIETMVVPNYLVTSEGAEGDVIYEVLAALFEARPTIARSIAAAGFLDRRQAIFTGPIELHLGAAQYYVDERQ